MPKNTIIIIAGATGVGKTAVALALAKRIDGAIISADSQQVYRGLTIGTAKPTPEECGDIEYAGVDLLDFDEQFDLATFIDYTESQISRFAEKGLKPIVAGGTGLYIKGLLEGIFEGPASDANLRKQLFDRLEREGADKLRAELAASDPEAAEQIHPNDRVRLVRALEVYEQTGRPISDLQRESRSPKPRWPFHLFVLNRKREALYRRIEKRIDAMLEAGWLDEVRGLRESGFNEDSPAARALGYRTLLQYLDGELALEQAIDRVKTVSRQYAKRQLTWFRQMHGARWVNIDDRSAENTAEEIELLLSKSPIESWAQNIADGIGASGKNVE